MPQAHLRTDIGSDHFPPTLATEPTYARKLAASSSTVFINGKPARRIGYAIDCDGEAPALV